jgi:4-amino-4-deoxy-L-arabinose transferase-like glycosyltransferase
MAAMFGLFGFEEWAARVPVALHGVLCLGSIGWIGWRLGGRLAGILAVAMLGGIGYFTRFANMTQFDVPCVAWPAAALAFYLQSLRRPDQRRRWVYLSGAAIGLGLMTKIAISGFVYPVIWSLQAAAFAARRRFAMEAPEGAGAPPAEGDLAFLLRAGEPKRLLVDNLVLVGAAAAVWLPWHIYMAAKHGQLFWTWYIGYHLLDRTKTSIDGEFYGWWINYLGIWTYAPGVMKGLIGVGAPMAVAWSLGPLLSGPKRNDRERALEGLALVPALAWTYLLFGVFQATVSKREEYMVLVYPALALLTGQVGARLARRAEPAAQLAIAGFGALSGMLIPRFSSAWESVWETLFEQGSEPGFLSHAAFYLNRYALACAVGFLALLLVAEAIAGAGAAEGRARRRRFAWQAALAAMLAVGLATGGLKDAYKPSKVLRKEIWEPLFPWVKDEAKFPRVLFVAWYWDIYGSSETYYLNGNTRKSKPISYRPIERVNDLADAPTERYRQPGCAIILSTWFVENAEAAEREEKLKGFRQAGRFRHYTVYEWDEAEEQP